MASDARPATISLIAAVAANGVIGDRGGLLWHLPEDLAHFRETTRGAPVIMGRKTWDSLPARFRPLPGRRNVVVTRHPQWAQAGAERAASLEDALARLKGLPRAFVIGGAELYALALPMADDLILTELGRDYSGDTHFPPWDREAFERRLLRPSIHHGETRVEFAHYRRRR